MFTCFHCSRQFKTKNRVREHILEKVCLKKAHFCWCGKGCASLNALQAHNARYHSVRTKLDTVPLNFVNFSAFQSWKQSFEEETVSKFVKPTSFVILKNGNKKTKYVCHRSGKTRLKTGERLRDLKKKGSCKLNARCPAFISIEENMHGLISGEYYGSHNHESEVQHLTLSRKEKKKIADCLNKGATFEEILDDIRKSSIDEHRLKRIHTLTRKDLHNIMQEFKISFKERLSRDATKIHSLVQECDQQFGENSPIKLFKPQNVEGAAEMEGASSEDFILIIMTPAQKQILSQSKPSQIYVDSSHGIKGFDYHLTTVLAVNASGTCLPVAFCISNVVNENIMKIFFSIVNKECGNIATSTFTSKDFPIFINTWCKVMTIPEKWQVDKNLPQNLQKMTINGEPDNLRTVLREIDDQLLTPFMQKFIVKLLGNESTKDSGTFFVNEFSDSSSDPLLDYRSHVEIHTNAKLDAMHRVLKEVYFKRLKVRRLDFSVFRLLKMAWDCLFERLTFLKKENDEYTVKICKNRHDAGMLIPFDDIIKKYQSYEVKSASSAKKTYFIQKDDFTCSCQSRCADCDTCLHVYSCSCVDFSFAKNFCKHVHAVSAFENSLSAKFVFSGTQDVNPVEIICPFEENSRLEEKYVRATKQELINDLIRLSRLMQTNCYETNVCEKAAHYVRKTLNLFLKNSSSALKKPELPSQIKKEQEVVLSKDLTNCNASICKEAGEQVQTEDANLMLVDDIVEEIVYVDMPLADDSCV